jgi:tetratricopeptide (TPR) repeat protein
LGRVSLANLELGNFDEAQTLLDQALVDDSSDTHCWWVKSMVFEKKGNIDSTIYCLNKALILTPLPNHLQKQMYFDYAIATFKLAKQSSKDRSELIKAAHKYIIKAMDIDPTNTDYKELLIKIKETN